MEQKQTVKPGPERISTPEELHSFMRVSSPKLWIILSLIVVLLIGLVVFASTRTMENTMPIRVTLYTYDWPVVNHPDGTLSYTQVLGEVPLDKINMVEIGMAVRVQNETGKVSMLMNTDTDKTAMIEIEMDRIPIPLPDGTYDGELVLETTTPLKFLMN